MYAYNENLFYYNKVNYYIIIFNALIYFYFLM